MQNMTTEWCSCECAMLIMFTNQLSCEMMVDFGLVNGDNARKWLYGQITRESSETNNKAFVLPYMDAVLGPDRCGCSRDHK